MKKFIVVFLLAISFAGASAQQKYFIYFKDKGISHLQKIEKNSSTYIEAKAALDDRCIERRKKVLGDDFITYEDLPVNEFYISELNKAGIKINRVLKWFNSVSAYLSLSQLDYVKSLPFIEKVELVRSFKSKDSIESQFNFSKIFDDTTTVALDPYYGSSFDQLQISDIPFVQSKGITGEGVIIGFLDSGFNWRNHPSLRYSKVIGEYDFVFNDANTANENEDVPNQDEHGTFCYSLVGGYSEGELIGVSYDSEFLLCKTEDLRSETKAEEDNYAAALEWLEARGVDITTSSLGYNIFNDESESYEYEEMDGKTAICTRALEIAFKKGVVTVNCAGNEGNNEWRHIIAPADGFNVISVGAVEKDSTLASFSSRGPTADGRMKPEILANGGNVYGANVFTSDFRTASGTSAAAPLVAGTAGLLLSVYPHLTNQQVRKILIESGSQAANPDNNMGYGIVSAKRAIAFPNLKSDLNSFTVNKIFFDENNIDGESVWLHYRTETGNFDSLKMSSSNEMFFSVRIPQFGIGEKMKFYFSYADQFGNQKIDPADAYYTFEFGSLEISKNTGNTVDIPRNFFLSQNYPNPFNSITTIEFSTLTPKNVRISVYNILGQKVKEVYRGLSNPGINYAVWNGLNEGGMSVGSGPYIYTLEMDGNIIANKMIFMK